MNTKFSLKSFFYRTAAVMMIAMMLFAVMPGTSASAAPSAAIAGGTWTNRYHSATLPGSNAASFAVPAGTNRMLVVALTYQNSSGSGALTLGSGVSYGGVAMTASSANAADAAAGNAQHVLVYYLKDNAVMNGTNKTLSVGITWPGATATMQDIWSAVFTGVDQSATPTALNYNSNSNGTSAAFTSPGLTVNAYDQAILVSVASRASTAVTWNAPTNWTKGDNRTAGPSGIPGVYGLAFVANRSIPSSDSTDTASVTGITSSRRSMTGLVMKAYRQSSSTSVESDTNPSAYGDSVTFTAAVNPAAATGTVEFYDGSTKLGEATLNAGQAALSTSALSIAGSPHSITATYLGDGSYTGSTSSAVSQTVVKANATCNITGFAGSYDKLAHGASGTCSGVGGETAGTLDLGVSYTDFPGGTAHWTFAGNSNYNDQAGDVQIDISKADAFCTVSGFSASYDGAAHGASGSCPGIDSEIAGTLDLGVSYTDFPGGSAHWSFTGNNNYKDQAGDVAIDISKADASCKITGFSGSYDGAAHGASGSCAGVDSQSAGTLDLGASYTDFPGGSAHWSFTGNDNYKDQAGDVAIDISKAEAVIDVLPYDVTYNGSAHVAKGTVTGVDGEDLTENLDLSATSHTDAASYKGDIWAFTAPNANYKDASGTVDNKIAPADPVIEVNAYSVTFNGLAHSSTGTATGVKGEDLSANLDLSATTHTAIGEYTDGWTFTAPNANYNDKSGTVKNLISAKLIPALNLSGGPFTYDGNPHAATVTSPVAGAVSDVKYVDSADVSSSDAPVNAGTYTVTADFLPVDTITYETLNDVTAGTITIEKAQPSCTVTAYTVVYNGASHTATGSCLGVGDVELVGLDLTATTHTAAGTYDDSWTFTDVTGNYKDDGGTVQDVINMDSTAPVVSSVVRADANNTAATRVHFTVTFSEVVTGVDTSAPYADFSLFTTGLSGASITDVSGSGSTYTVTVNTGVGSGTIRLDVLDDDSIVDGGNNPLGGAFTTGQAYNVVKPLTFSDVPASNPYYKDIEILYANNLTGGCSTGPLKFCPDQILNRAQTAVFMLRANFGPLYAPPAATHIFKDDWTKGPWAEPWAEAMRNNNYSAGCLTSPLKFCPWDQIPREQAVIFVLKIKYGKDYTPPAATGTVFADMKTASYYATAWAEQAYKEGLIDSCGMTAGKPNFCPKALVSRGLAAHMIVKAKNLSMP